MYYTYNIIYQTVLYIKIKCLNENYVFIYLNSFHFFSEEKEEQKKAMFKIF